MRTVGSHLLEDKMDEAVTHYINSHQTSEVHVDASTLSLHVDTGRVVTVMHGQGFSQLSRQVSVSEHVGDGPWSEELLDSDERLDALVAHLAQHSRASQHHPSHHKVTSVRGDVDASVILDAPLRLFNGQTLDGHTEPLVVHVPPLPPLQDMKRCPDADWFSKSKGALKNDTDLLPDVARPPPPPQGAAVASPGAGAAASRQHSRKSLPHKKRISRKLKRNPGNTTPQQDIVVINCSDDVQQEEILPDNFVHAVQHHDMPGDTHHIAHEVRPILICQVCGEFYGEDQLKFYHHLKHHYEPHGTIIIENPVAGQVTDLNIDKMTSTCIVDNVATLPDSIVELSLENTVPKTMYQPMDKHILYTTSDKTLYSNKVQYSMASMEKEPVSAGAADADKGLLYESLDKLELYSCSKCNKSFRKHKQCEAHVKEAHSTSKLEDMGEFSEPEDLMEGIHVAVEEGGEPYDHDQTLLPHLTVENGHVHQEHVRHWYLRNGGEALGACGAEGAYCPVCPAPPPAPPPPSTAPPPPAHHSPQHLKEEVLQRIFEVDVGSSEPSFPASMLPGEPAELHGEPAEPRDDDDKPPEETDDKKKVKKFECPQCGRVFQHRNSLLYHVLSHGGKQQVCRDCGKAFYTANALKIHKRVHNGDKPYKCEECGRDFRQWSDLKYHRVSLHSDQKHFKCEFCGKEFARKYSLNVHRRIHTGEKNYKCEYCNKTFRASSYRLSHMRTHTGDRPYKCSLCEKCFRVAGDMRRHLLTHEKVRNRYEEQNKRPREEKLRKPHKDDVKTEASKKETEHTSPKHKKIALASTTRPPLPRNVDNKNKQKPVKKNQIKKGGAPNVTVSQNKTEGQIKINTEYTNNVEVFDTRQVDYSKFKEVYSESNSEYSKDEIITYKVKDYDEQIIYKGNEQRLADDREFAILRPTFRNNFCGDSEKQVFEYRPENTDGKMHVFTHVEKKDYSGPIVSHSVTLSDIRSVDRERGGGGEEMIHVENNIENGFLDKLTAFYNIPAV